MGWRGAHHRLIALFSPSVVLRVEFYFRLPLVHGESFREMLSDIFHSLEIALRAIAQLQPLRVWLNIRLYVSARHIALSNFQPCPFKGCPLSKSVILSSKLIDSLYAYQYQFEAITMF